ncbi:MAG: sugar phosphate nucleotidyltransferase [Acidobacteriota bacterium]|nr:sugar phosphate nucleotidyltransferase [Acidobacteriota bacterium]MDQ3168955.1 sugar phosphate nucleotidyltransferase [Acidobacteriota bacterium]
MLPCLVLTAGLGTRLRPLTDLVAKPALPVAGQPLVSRILTWLATQGIDDAVLNLSHLPHTVSGVVGDGSQFGIRVRYSWEQPVLGSAGGPRHALPLLDATRFVIVNGDTLTDVVINDVIAAHAASGASVTMAVVPHPAPGRYGGVQVSDDGRIEAFTARSNAAEGALWHYIGVQVVEASVFADLPGNVPAESVGGVYRDLVKQGRVCAHRSEALFRDIGRPDDYLDTAFAVAHAEGSLSPVIEEAGAEYEPGAVVDRVILWSGSRVAAGASLRNCIVAGGHVPAGTTAENACILPGGDGLQITPFA